LPTNSSLSPELRAFAQVPDRHAWIGSDVERYADERVCILQGTVWAGVAGVRVNADEVEALLAEVRERIPPEKLQVWWIDPDAQPADLYERLLRLGLREPEDGAGLLHSLVCVEPPAPGPADVVVRKVETFEDQLAAVQVMWDAFGTTEARREQQRPHLRREFEAAQEAGVPITFLAELDGEPVGLGRSIYSDHGVFLIAGAVAEAARGRGVYRALVRARWDDAVQRGTPALVTEAMPDTSYPVLLRLGFTEVCTIRRLEDARS
jgi:GNAT superfamily N-acetyltransferase